MNQNFSQNHFELFDLPVQFDLDLDKLDQHYRKVQSEVHPDRFAAASGSERLKSMQLATQANEAYQTLKNPTSRARYLLHLHGIDTQEESNTAMPADFLMLQMEWREAIEEATDANDIDALDKLLDQTRKAARQFQQDLQHQLGTTQTFEQASGTVRKLSFIDKVQSDIGQAIIKLEDA
ncbi:MAG: Fe-S protein assembly co-chaperone HscB [Betaproteobacteria bacterium HGW-Betaproteobacteria-8]|nr:MAG: Fe-S protein assembly co-chaperone HscB [Betaproteobacteria bacterium HGW-Betaproteobacteria-8]